MDSVRVKYGAQVNPSGKLREAWIVAIDQSIPEWPVNVAYFKDRSRMIDGLVRVRSLTEKDVMEAYDHGRYEPA